MALRTGKNYKVKVGSAFAKRLQSFNTGQSKNLSTYHEMGNASPVGVEADQNNYTASLSWFPIDNTMEQQLAGLGDVDLDLQDIIDAAGILVESSTDGIDGAKVASLEYSCQVGGEFQASAQLRGTSYTDGNAAISATAISGAPVYKAKDIVILMDGVRALRATGFRLRIEIPTDENYQFSEEDPFETTSDSPNITLEVDWHEDTAATGMIEPTVAAPKDAIIAVAGIGKKITVKNLVLQEKGAEGRVRGAGSRRYSYMSSGDATTGGVALSKTTAPTCSLAASPASVVVGAVSTLTATVADADGIYRVDFYKNGVKMGSDSSTPFTYAWTSDAVGVHSWVAVAQDIYGAKTTSAAATVTVTSS